MAFHAGATYFVDRGSRRVVLKTRLSHRLSRWSLPNPGANNATHQHFVHRRWVDLGTNQGRLDCMGT